MSSIDSSKYKVIPITTDNKTSEIKEYLQTYEVSSWNVLSIESEDAEQYALSGTPITVVVDNTGKVEKVWGGLWQRKEISDVENYFNISLSPIVAAK